MVDPRCAGAGAGGAPSEPHPPPFPLPASTVTRPPASRAAAARTKVYVADFAVDVLEPTRVLQLVRETYEVVCKAARQEAEATHSLARAAAPPSPSAAAATVWVDEAAAGRDAGQDAAGWSALTPSASSTGGPSLQPKPFFSDSSSSELARPPAGGIAIEMMGALPPASEDAAV